MYASMQENPALDAARAMAAQTPASHSGGVDTTRLEEQLCAEAGLWAIAAARRALDQARGDTAAAVCILKVWAATQPHLHALPVSPDRVTVVRRLSSAYPRIPGGQWLGLAPDLASRHLNWEDPPTTAAPEPVANGPAPGEAPTRGELPRVRDLVAGSPMVAQSEDGAGEDPAATVLVPPLSRASRLAMLARGETGALVALAALILGRRQEAVLIELTVGYASIEIPHPRTGLPCAVAEVPITEIEAVLDADVDGRPGLAMGWGATLGTVERRAIALALLDAAMQADGDLREPLLLDEQTLLAATDGSATTGFVEHLRLPHHATFSAYLSQASAKAAQ